MNSLLNYSIFKNKYFSLKNKLIINKTINYKF